MTIVGGSVITEQAVATLGIGPGAWATISLLRYPLMLALVAVAVAALFRFGPNVAVSFRWTMVGGVVFAIGWLLATAVFGLYVANFGSYANTYGALGGVIVLMLWFYLTAVHAARRGGGDGGAREAARAREGRCAARRDRPGRVVEGWTSARGVADAEAGAHAERGAGAEARAGDDGGGILAEARPRGRGRGPSPAVVDDRNGASGVVRRARARRSCWSR